jgi:phosphate transport system substrate-binding protein
MIFQGVKDSKKQHGMLPQLGTLALLSLILLLAACGGGGGGNTTTTTGNGSNGTSCPSTKNLTGAGSTFDNPLFQKMFSVYPSVKCGGNVNYQSVGSGAGINDLLQQIVDFGATDSPLTDAQLAKSPNGPILHIPVTLGATAIVYNLPGIDSGKIQLTGPIIANMYLGKITSWNDPAIKQINPNVTLPNKNITIVHRSDGSGTTGIFTHYLSAVSPDWQSKVGAATTVNWPTGVGGKGNAGVAAAVKGTVGSIGYVELAYAVSNNIPFTLVQNKNGKYVAPSLDGAKADAANVTTIPADLRFYIVNAPGDASYPISGFSWIVVYQNQSNADKGQALVNLLWWMVHSGQQYSTALTYVPLPSAIVTKSEAQIKAMKCGGSACYTG